MPLFLYPKNVMLRSNIFGKTDSEKHKKNTGTIETPNNTLKTYVVNFPIYKSFILPKYITVIYYINLRDPVWSFVYFHLLSVSVSFSHSFWFVVTNCPFVVIRFDLLSLVVNRCTTCCRLLLLVVLFVVTHCPLMKQPWH